MCGIIGYIGKREALPILVEGLKKLEYRGYDSSGVVVFDNGGKTSIFKAIGKIENLEKKLMDKKILGHAGIAHTRWATHGEPTEENAHPHNGCDDSIWVAHNGIIENYQELKKTLIRKGHKFTSQTDTEVVAHLIEEFFQGNLTLAVQKAIKLIKGAYGLVVMHKDEPGKMVAAKLSSPIIIGIGDDEIVVTSDASAILSIAKKAIYLDDGEIVEINGAEVRIFNAKNKKIAKEIENLEWDKDQAQKKDFPHFMFKEIFEQPAAVSNSLLGRFTKNGEAILGGLDLVKNKLAKVKKIIIVACGTARCAGMVGEYMLEEFGNIPVEVEYASEFRYRKSPLDKNTAILAISQSGETADTLAAIKNAKNDGLLTLGIVNIVGSSIARATDAGVYTRSGPEIAVASTKAFTSQLAVLALMSVYFGRERGMKSATAKKIIQELKRITELIKNVLKASNQIKKIASRYAAYPNFAFMGRKYNQPIAFEGAIKLKEVSYIHAEGFPSGEMKHGPIAMIDKDFPSVIIAPKDSVYEKSLSNMEEIKARKGKIIAIATKGDREIKRIADDVIYIPETLEMFYPMLTVIPLQLFAYHMAILKKLDVDKPRNLAKSVTVE